MTDGWRKSKGRLAIKARCAELQQLLRLVRAILRREPWSHITDLWGEFTGRLVLCGTPPHQYLMVRKYIRRKS